MQHYLASRQTIDIPIKNLYVEYKFWIEEKKPFETVKDELATLSRQGDYFRRILQPSAEDPIKPLVTFLDTFDIRTAYPLLLCLLEAKFSEEQWREVSSILESYLLRRAICGLPTKNYNRIFLNMTRFLAREGGSPEAIFVYLSDLAGESTAWPSDDEFREAWITKHTFQTLAFSKRIVHIFLRLNATYISTMVEEITINSPMTVEHILPKNWLEKWPLPDGTKGLDSLQLWDSSEDDERAVATRRRNAALETLGNLTIMVQPLNSTLSNGAWREKKPEFLNSLLPINQKLALLETWDEEAIAKRSGELFERAVRIWPGPGKRRA